MAPNPKNTLSTNHFQALEAAVNFVKKEFEKYKDTAAAKDFEERGKLLLKTLGELKPKASMLALDDPGYTKAKADVTLFQKEAKTALTDCANAITAEHCQALEALAASVKDMIAKAKQGASDEGKRLLGEAEVLTKRINNLKLKIGKIPFTHKDYVDTKAFGGKLVNETRNVLAVLAKAPQHILKFGGDEVDDEKALVAKIKQYLPSSGHGNISQALNDVILGRGKATTGHSGVLHASAGPQQKGKGCTLFFKRSGNIADVVGVGQHEEVKSGQNPKYMIHYGLGMKGKVLSL